MPETSKRTSVFESQDPTYVCEEIYVHPQRDLCTPTKRPMPETEKRDIQSFNLKT